jgi:hypothetical protein
MAKPTCPKCGKTEFELQELKIDHASYRHNVINCKYCGCIITVMELFNINARMNTFAKKLHVNIDG